MADEAAGTARQRLDRWLFFARIVKSRTLAQKLIASGAVRVDGQRVTGADYRLSPGMVLTLNPDNRLIILKVLAPGTRRGPAPEARTLYEDLSPEMPKTAPKPVPAARPAGAGRPTKKERRLTDRLHGAPKTPPR